MAFRLESQTFLASVFDMYRFDLTTLYTLQHRLPGNSQKAHSLVHRKIAIWSLLEYSRTQFIS